MTSACGREDLEGVGAESKRQPRLAVLIPVFNDHAGLQKSLASLAQDGSEFDVFLVDDGSQPPIEIPPDLPFQVRLLRQEPNRGIAAALNAGLAPISEAGYQYVARLDACDLSLPGRFAAQMAFLDEHPEHAVVGTPTRRVDTGGNLLFYTRPPTEHNALKRFLRYRAGITHASSMMRMQALRECGFYREEFNGGEDYELFLRVSKKYKLANLPTIYLIVEIRPDSITSRRQSLLILRLRMLLRHFDPWSIHSYLGIATNTVSLLAPRALVLRSKRLWAHWRERKVGAL